MADGIAVAALPDRGAPQAGVTITGLDTAAPSVISVEVSADGGATWETVRGADRITATGSAFVRDHLVPLNAVCTYRLVVHSGAKTPAVTLSSFRVDSDVAWIQDPLNPRAQVAIHADRLPDSGGDVLLTSGSLASALFEQHIDRVVPLGGTRAVASIGQRVAAGEVPLRLTHQIAQDATSLRNLLLGAGVVALRGLPAGTMLPAVAHVTVGPANVAILGANQIATWDLKVSQVAPPSLRIVVPWWTYAQVADLWHGANNVTAGTGTYDGVKSFMAPRTYAEVQSNPAP